MGGKLKQMVTQTSNRAIRENTKRQRDQQAGAATAPSAAPASAQPTDYIRRRASIMGGAGLRIA